MTNNWIQHFPFEKPRQQQSNAINSVIDAFKSGKKYAIIDCGTGVGKSAIGLTIAKACSSELSEDLPGVFQDGAYFLTTQKLLQDQYEKDFSRSSGLVSLYSSSNYICSVDKKSTCKEVQTALRAKSLPKKFDCCGYKCKYKEKKKLFVEKDLSITNFSYFLTEKNYSKKMPNKKILVIDEAHNLENELSRFIEISVSSYFSDKILKLKPPKDLRTQGQVFKWIKESYFPAVTKKKNNITNQLEKLGISTDKLQEFQKITKHLDMLNSHKEKIDQFLKLYSSENWVFDIEESDSSYKKFVFKPIDISRYAKEYILQYADYVIFMSATIISHEGFSLTLGLPADEVVSVKEPSPFPPENRPIIFSPAGSMSFKNIDKTLPKMTNMIASILDHHQNEKGIIHTHSVKIAKNIMFNIPRKYKNRLLIAYGENRNEVLKKHMKSSKNTVLLTPSMAEGVDLKGELSKFQIICKIPFPYLGDKVVKKKMAKWNWWYNTQTVRTIIQSIGRSIRCETDTAVTYILDDDWARLKSKVSDLLPDDFFDSYNE